MKITSLVVLLFAAGFAPASAAIKSTEAGSHVGETTVVRGTVAQVSTVGGGMTFVNFGQAHPNSEFTAVVKPGSGDFGDLSVLQGKEVDVEGLVEVHKGRPQVVLSSPTSIRVAGEVTPGQVDQAVSAPVVVPSPTPGVSAVEDKDEDTSPPAGTRGASMEEFKVPLTPEEKRMAGRSPAGVTPAEATVGLMLPEGFDPSQPQKVLVVFSTDDNGGAHLKPMPRFGGIATRNGWVAIAATGPVLEEKLPPEWHAAMIYAGLRALEERYPDAKKWRFFTGGNSGGGLRSAMMSCALLKKGYPVEGVFMGGAGDERFSAGQAIFRPDRTKVRDLAVYLAIGKNDPMINAARADFVAEAVKKQGIKNIRRDTYDGGHGMNEESFAKALEWLAGGGK
ncbi:MAG: hypothetical protein ACOYOL_01220 [Chthoniobacterales bacterium]